MPALPQTLSPIRGGSDGAGYLKQVNSAFNAYQLARQQFVAAVQVFVERTDSYTQEALIQNDVLAVLCCPLLHDPLPGVQANALLSLASLAKTQPQACEALINSGALDSVVLSLRHDSRSIQIAANKVLQAVACHSEESAITVLHSGAMEFVKEQLTDITSSDVQEAAVQTLSTFLQVSEELTMKVLDNGVLNVLVSVLKTPSTGGQLTKAIVIALCHICRLNEDFASRVTSAHALPCLAAIVTNKQIKHDLRKEAMGCLAHVAQHSETLASQVMSQNVVPHAVLGLTEPLLPGLRLASSSLMLQLAKKGPKFVDHVLECGGASGLAHNLQLEKGSADATRVGVLLAGYIAGYHQHNAKELVDAGVTSHIVEALRKDQEEVVGAAAWALEQMGIHGEEVAGALVQHGVLTPLFDGYAARVSGESELGPSAATPKLKAALKVCIRGCNDASALQPFIHESTPLNMIKHLLKQLLPLLSHSGKIRQGFVTSGALMRLQRLPEAPETHPVCTLVPSINELFPAEVVRYYQA